MWVALFDGGGVQRFRPDGGADGFVAFPCRHVTKIAFGGEDLRTAYATTARQLLSADEIAKQPQIGDLFAFSVDVPGIPCPLVRF